ncbi:hypothetical protein GCM10023142_07530 [Anaerocolumna aminovalerica]|jgi:Mg2+ and Co2+ transporter CorA|uniref:Uncharacterized protein n=1 Tax=Anaerocolumna aminovalerica TaxID=1527 RepID=A0A1I5I1V8_9FIRM|nr:hypothetical protein [Anaerocolumna aminovalerica]MBU5334782.1 hypothetical protein [Anaerocolumna aminovalerica]MDU6266685.1 hypothetical protein [Anaerocolumna aminovalerica]SFO54021.1 hypothetical protein SAMN04489757_13749 [Anaerocolumna aminovalerica]
MAVLLKLLGIVSIVMLISTIICGLWIKSHPQEDIQFHFVLSLTTVIISLLTIVLFMLKK